MSSAYGIHLGNSTACLASFVNGLSAVIANDAGDRVTPAVIALNGTEWELGLPAKSGQLNSKSVNKHNKRLMNCDWNEQDLLCVQNSSTCRVINDDKIGYEFKTNDTTLYVDPDFITTKFFSKLFTTASHSLKSESDLKLVIASPLHWNEESCQRLAKCAELAGFDVCQVISEPAAAALAYNLDDEIEDINVLVFRLGGSSCDATIVKINGGFMTVEFNVFSSEISGNRLTEDLAIFMAEEFYKKWKLDPRESRKAMAKLLQHAENCKHILSTLNTAHVFIESLLDGLDWSQNMSRARFENIISSKISSYIEPAVKVINSFKGKIHKIVLCGGSMKIPKLQTAVANLLPDADILSSISPDEVIALGCARQAGMLIDLPEMGFNYYNTHVEFLNKDVYVKYLDKIIQLFKEGASLYTQNSCTIDVDDSIKTILFTLHETPDSDALASESFDLEGVSKPFMLKATLQQSNIILQIN